MGEFLDCGGDRYCTCVFDLPSVGLSRRSR